MTNKIPNEFPSFKEKFPVLYNKIESVWGEPECRNLISHLVNDTRDGKRAGFPTPVGLELIHMFKVHDELFPEYDTSTHHSFHHHHAFTSGPKSIYQPKMQEDFNFLTFIGKAATIVILLVVVAKTIKFYFY